MAYNRTDPAQRNALLAEVQLPANADDFTAGNDAAIANRLNTPNASITVDRGMIDADKVTSAIALADWLTLTADQKDYLRLITSGQQVDSGSAQVSGAIGTIFAGKGSLARLQAVGRRNPASRAEQLFGFGTVIAHADISQLREPA